MALPGVASGRRGDRFHPPLLPIGILFSPRSIAIQQRSAYRRNFRTASLLTAPFGPGIGHPRRASPPRRGRCGAAPGCPVPCSLLPSRLLPGSQVSSLSGGAAALQRLLLRLRQGATSPHVPARESYEEAKRGARLCPPRSFRSVGQRDSIPRVFPRKPGRELKTHVFLNYFYFYFYVAIFTPGVHCS